MEDFKTVLNETVSRLCTHGRGILAADESIGTIGKRFSKIGVENTLENRIKYRQLLFNIPNLNQHICGVITFDETLRSKNKDMTPLVKPLLDQGIIVGIKVDMKVLKISKNCPSSLAILENAVTLARYASICQNNGLVPIVEPEILMDGGHDLETTQKVTTLVLSEVYRQLILHNVELKYTLLKPNMVRPGVDCQKNYSVKQIAEATINSLRNTVPVSVPGIFFLSGGLSEQEATTILNEINKTGILQPWYLSFSYGRALQASVLDKWNGVDENIKEAKKTLMYRSYMNGLATIGKYNGEEDKGESLYEKDYIY